MRNEAVPFDLGSAVGQLRWLTEVPVPPELIPDLLSELERTRAVLMARLMAPRQRAGGAADRNERESYLTAAEVADHLNVSKRWVYDHARELGGFGTRRMRRFPESLVERYVERMRKR